MKIRWLQVTMICGVAYAVGLAARLYQLDASNVLSDSLGPYLTAFVNPFELVPHAEPYGWALAPPFAASLALADSLRQAVGWTMAWHALAAPLAALLVLRLNPRSWVAALAAGVLVALDGGLLDTSRSGSECYLGPVWVGCMAVGAASGERWWGPPLACCAFSVACMNHPYAVCTLPLLTMLPLRAKATWIGAVLGMGLLSPRILRLLENPLPGPGGPLGRVADALPAYIDQGAPGAWILLAAPFIAIACRGTRGWALRVLTSFAALFAIGLLAGYLRDHHLRLLSVPLAGGLAAIPNRYAALSLLFVRPPGSHAMPPGAPPRSASLALAEDVTSQVMARAGDGRIVVDRAWMSGPPAAEPSAVMLDLYLRGWSQERFAPGGQVALIVSARREDLARLDLGGSSWDGNSSYVVLIADWKDIRRRTEALCGSNPRIGGAWDGLIAFRPETRSEELEAWWAPCLLEKGEE